MLKGFLSLFFLFQPIPADPLYGEGAFNATDLLEVYPIPSLQASAWAPVVDAKAALLMDIHTGFLLYEKNINEPLPMASLTKIMTAILILENHSMDEIVTVDQNFGNLEGVKIGLRQGEALTVYDLMKALLIRSGGDAAVALAKHHSGSVEAFVEQMNQKAAELSLKDTFFVNPVGLDDDGHQSTALQLALLTRYALRFNEFRQIVRMPSATITSLAGNNYTFQSTNYLLDGYLNILGVKTGTTDAAGQCLIALVEDSQGNEVLAIVLNSPNRFPEVTSMLDWALRSYLW